MVEQSEMVEKLVFLSIGSKITLSIDFFSWKLKITKHDTQLNFPKSEVSRNSLVRAL